MFWHALERSRSEKLIFDGSDFIHKIKIIFITHQTVTESLKSLVQKVGLSCFPVRFRFGLSFPFRFRFGLSCFPFRLCAWTSLCAVFRKAWYCFHLITTCHELWVSRNCKEIFRLQSSVTTFFVDKSTPSHPGFVQTIPQRCVYTPGGLRGLLEAQFRNMKYPPIGQGGSIWIG